MIRVWPSNCALATRRSAPATTRTSGTGTPSSSTENHYRAVSRFWTPDANAYTCLGQMYVDDERFRGNYEKITAGLAEFQRDAMAAFARTRLS